MAKAYERWIPLQEKLSEILTDIYQVKNLRGQKVWSSFTKLEQLRHDIIHQKSIQRTDFYKKYFDGDIFRVCESGEEIIKFFYEKHSKQNKTNPLWPWLINKEKEFPVRYDFDSENFEVVGNLFEGLKKK